MSEKLYRLPDYPNRTEPPVLSISCIVYNQKDHIRGTLDGFLKQETSFPVEILVTDDVSTDGTKEILQEYELKYPWLVKVLYQTKNQFREGKKGLHSINFNRSNAKYIATCEGDDFWCNPRKVQTQYEFLESHPDFSMCSHEAFLAKWDINKSLKSVLGILFRNLQYLGAKDMIRAVKLLLTGDPSFWKKKICYPGNKRFRKANLRKILLSYFDNIYIPTLSIFARGNVLRSLPDNLYLSPTGHKMIIVWSALKGKIYHFPFAFGQKNTIEGSISVTKEHINYNLHKKAERFISAYKKLEKYATTEQVPEIELAIKKLEQKKLNLSND